MLGIGKNLKDSENEALSERQNGPYTNPGTFDSDRGTTTREVKLQCENTSQTSRALTESESLAREIREGNMSGFVGSGTVVTGEANFKALMRVDGQISGRISSIGGTLIVGTNGKVDANIEVAIAIIHGTVNGDIVATQRLELGRVAKLKGNIQSASLVIEPGALFEGSCRMIKASADATKTKSDERNDYQPVDAASMKPISDSPDKPAQVPILRSGPS